ncbi:MAG: hypothetical protein HWD59_14035 [Coxiellaceae bacterium]|nr:MAG: hypothetical protein HWD59_14035 [Coxiellaceae bacterium]
MHKPIPYLFIISLGLLATSCSTMNSPSAAGVDLRNTYLTVHLQNGTAGVNQKIINPLFLK